MEEEIIDAKVEEDEFENPENDDSISEFENFQNDDSGDNYDDVLQLTSYDDSMLVPTDSYGGEIAPYEQIDIVSIDKKYERQAKSFVGKITKFISEFEDVELSDIHKRYLKEVGYLQMSNLKDMLVLVEMNKQMLDNIVRRINTVRIEDYSLVNTYNLLMNQHIKLMKELQNTYKSIPSTIKRLRNEVLSASEDDNKVQKNEVYTEEIGIKQFNNQKDLIRKLRQEYEERQKAENNSTKSIPNYAN